MLGITSTPAARTVFNTVQYTQTLILAPGTVTANCNSATQTVTNYPRGPTVTTTTTVLRTATDGARTSVYTTTATSQAVCHYPQSGSNPTGRPPPDATATFCIGESCLPPIFQNGRRGVAGGDSRPLNGHRRRSEARGAVRRDANVGVAAAAEKRAIVDITFVTEEKRTAEKRAAGAVAAVTVTVTQTTYTHTQTVVTTIPARTTTEIVMRTITATVYVFLPSLFA